MKITDMKTKKWYKVQLIQRSKQIKITKQEFNTKTEGLEKGISKGYDILNLKAVNKLLSVGWIEYQPKEENATETIVEVVETTTPQKSTWTPQYIVGNPEVEKQIVEYVNKKQQKKAVQFVKTNGVKNEMSDAEKIFLASLPTQPKYKPLSVEKYALTDKQYKSNVEAVKRQRESYCGGVI